jgi:hypothetical protein
VLRDKTGNMMARMSKSKCPTPIMKMKGFIQKRKRKENETMKGIPLLKLINSRQPSIVLLAGKSNTYNANGRHSS